MQYEDELQNKTVFGYLREWKSLIKELSEKELALIEWKELYEIKADEIIQNTDFKQLYGANNQKVRDNHIKHELSDWNKNIQDLKISIDWINRRISFIKHYVKFMCKED